MPAKTLKAPRQPRAQATIDAFLNAAARILAEHGAAAVTTNAVAEAAGASIGSLYQYFPNKFALIDAVRQQHVDALLDVLHRANDPRALSSVRIAAFVDGMIALHERYPFAYRDTVDSHCQRAYEAFFESITHCPAKHVATGARVLAGAVAGALRESTRRDAAVWRWELNALVESYLSKPRPQPVSTKHDTPPKPRASRKHLRLRKQPTQSRSEETVASIIEAAAQVLENEGFEGFNTNAVAGRAGVSIGSLYQYFPGKDALTVALIHRETKRFYDDAAHALEQRSGKAALEYLIGAAVRQQLRRPMLARLLDIEESRPALRGEVANVGMENLFAQVLKRAAPKHQRLDVATEDLFAIIRGMVDAAGERGERDLPSLERRVCAAVFGYLSKSAT